MHLLGLKAKNIKILKAVDIDFKNNGVVYISGKNDQGKSTVIDSIHVALAGKSHYKDQTKMRNKNASEDDECYVIADLDEYKVKRWFTSSGNDYIEITNNDDIKQGSPETLLQKFYSDHCRNPQEMINMDKDEQINFLYALMGIEEKIAEINDEYKLIYSDRRDINRDLKQAKGHLDSLPEPPEELPEKINVSDLMSKVNAIEQDNQKILSKKQEYNSEIKSQKSEVDRAEYTIENLKEKLEEAEQERQDAEDRIDQLEENVSDLPDLTDASDMKEKISKAEEINALHAQAEKHESAKEAVDDLQSKSDEKTNELEALDEAKQQLLEDNDLPVDGVSIEDGELHREGLPISQLSTTESIKFWSKLWVATDPRLRLMTLHRGESLDSENRKELEQFAEENDILYIVEMVDEKGKTGIVIENGMVKRNNS